MGDVVRTSCLVGVRELVAGTDLPFSEIAVRCGQRSAAHLADVFRRRYGKTMTEMRNSAK